MHAEDFSSVPCSALFFDLTPIGPKMFNFKISKWLVAEHFTFILWEDVSVFFSFKWINSYENIDTRFDKTKRC